MCPNKQQESLLIRELGHNKQGWVWPWSIFSSPNVEMKNIFSASDGDSLGLYYDRSQALLALLVGVLLVSHTVLI